MRVALISANVGGYEAQAPSWPELDAVAGVSIDVHRFDDANLPPRPLAMTSRLMCGIPKMDGWRLVPGYDAYLWIDASCAPTSIAVAWFLQQLGDAEIAVFRHPDRKTIREEVDFMLARMARKGETYLNARYRGEWIDDLYRHIAADRLFFDQSLYASTAFVYRPTLAVKAMLWDWWAAKARWCLHDQIYWPYAIWKAGCSVNVIEQNYLQCPALRFVRRGKRRAA